MGAGGIWPRSPDGGRVARITSVGEVVVSRNMVKPDSITTQIVMPSTGDHGASIASSRASPGASSHGGKAAALNHNPPQCWSSRKAQIQISQSKTVLAIGPLLEILAYVLE